MWAISALILSYVSTDCTPHPICKLYRMSECLVICNSCIFLNAHQKTYPMFFFFFFYSQQFRGSNREVLGACSNKHTTGENMNDQSKNRAFSIQNGVIFQSTHGAILHKLKMSSAKSPNLTLKTKWTTTL